MFYLISINNLFQSSGNNLISSLKILDLAIKEANKICMEDVNFCERIGISKSENNIDISVLEDCAREELDKTAPRAMAVLRPLKVIIANFPEEHTEQFKPSCHPKKEEMGTRTINFSREIVFLKLIEYLRFATDCAPQPSRASIFE